MNEFLKVLLNIRSLRAAIRELPFEQLQEAKVRLDKKMVLLSDDENCDQGMLIAAFVPAMTSHTREKFFEEIALVLEGVQA